MAVRGSNCRGGALTLQDFQADGAERRTEPRFPCDRQIAILPFEGWSEKWTFRGVGLFDCSLHGLGIVSEEEMPPGSQFFAKLKGETITLMRYIVRHCQPMRGGRDFKIGARFQGFVGEPRAGCAAASGSAGRGRGRAWG